SSAARWPTASSTRSSHTAGASPGAFSARGGGAWAGGGCSTTPATPSPPTTTFQPRPAPAGAAARLSPRPPPPRRAPLARGAPRGLSLPGRPAAPAALHVASGMFGLIFVEPRRGLPKVDREFQIVQSEFYTEGKFGERGPTHFSAEKALNEQPEYVLFNGRVDSLAGAHALQARTGERVRLYFANAWPNLTSSFHVEGELFDTYGEGGVTLSGHDVQSTAVASGGATVVEFTPQVPGDYSIVDHSLVRSNSKGARGTLTVAGADNRMLFTGTTAE